ncbi:YchJ family protein [Azospirillum picis]|uniref:SEC-C motif-containing protein n=1 Tax=Azospirillum picis TaxID=488438 RepID=A0ABU0MDL3_9PROT|nr:YchJ family protein [Azospirillum picis]MBP2297447.1 SEC-C motif-containing protein [Azospirillum picis]MDQ0531530.1 SEC-C motif-containing protein [Azospirillum picis]
MTDSTTQTAAECPCRSGRPLDACCGPYLAGMPAPTAEALMRSRYTAFATGNIDYLHDTLLPSTRDDFNREEIEAWANNSVWTGVEIRSTEAGQPGDGEGVVEFVARFTMNGKPMTHHETSRFTHQDGRWYYVEGFLGTRPRSGPKVGRNDPCPCGSGKKYKKCHGAAA